LGWNRKTIAGIPHSVPCDRGIHGEEQRIETGCVSTLHQIIRLIPVFHHIQLEPVTTLRVYSLHFFNRHCPQGGQTKWNTRLASSTGTSDLTFGLHHARNPDERNTKRKSTRTV